MESFGFNKPSFRPMPGESLTEEQAHAATERLRQGETRGNVVELEPTAIGDVIETLSAQFSDEQILQIFSGSMRDEAERYIENRKKLAH